MAPSHPTGPVRRGHASPGRIGPVVDGWPGPRIVGPWGEIDRVFRWRVFPTRESRNYLCLMSQLSGESHELADSPPVDAVLDAAAACYLRYGVDKTTAVDIAKVAGMAWATLYRRYGSHVATFLTVLTRKPMAMARDAGRLVAADHPGAAAPGTPGQVVDRLATAQAGDDRGWKMPLGGTLGPAVGRSPASLDVRRARHGEGGDPRSTGGGTGSEGRAAHGSGEMRRSGITRAGRWSRAPRVVGR
jgi:hypothetical protein